MRPLDTLSYIQWLDNQQIPQRLYPDSVTDYSVQLSADATTHPIESGADIVDHYRSTNTEISLTCVFSDLPLRGDLSQAYPGKASPVALKYPPNQQRRDFSIGRALTGAAAELLGAAKKLPTSAEMLVFDQPPKRGAEALSVIRGLRDDSRLVLVKLPIGEFTPLLITSASLEQNNDTLTTVTMTLRLVTFATTQEVLALEPRATTSVRAGIKAKANTMTDATTTAAGRPSSLAKSLSGGGVGKSMAEIIKAIAGG